VCAVYSRARINRGNTVSTFKFWAY